MNTTERRQEKIQTELVQIRAELNKLKAQAREVSLEQQLRFDGYLDKLEDKSNEVNAKLEQLKDSGDDATDEVRTGLTEAWERLAIAKQAAKAQFH